MAKLIEAVSNTSYLSDVGYRFRVVTAGQARHILARSRLDGSAYVLEMLIISVITHTRTVQVPLSCHPRVGISSVTVDLGKSISLGLEMIGLTIAMPIRARTIRRGR